jgi:uncharacterized membrane protein
MLKQRSNILKTFAVLTSVFIIFLAKNHRFSGSTGGSVVMFSVFCFLAGIISIFGVFLQRNWVKVSILLIILSLITLLPLIVILIEDATDHGLPRIFVWLLVVSSIDVFVAILSAILIYRRGYDRKENELGDSDEELQEHV